MEEYHTPCAPSSATYVGSRKLGPFESILTPPIQLVLNAILDHCAVGGSIRPGIRNLAEWSGVSRGLITQQLRELDRLDWISYDGRVIMLLRHPDDDGEDAESDRSHDRSLYAEVRELVERAIDHVIDQEDEASEPVQPPRPRRLIDRIRARKAAESQGDRSHDRSRDADFETPHTPPMVSHEQQQLESAAALKKEVPCAAQSDRSVDHLSPVVQALFDHGADDVIIAAALAARPDLTIDQVAATWQHFEQRQRDGGVRSAGAAFCGAIRKGQLHAAPPAAGRPIVVDDYIATDPNFFRLGSDLTGLVPPESDVGLPTPDHRHPTPDPPAAPPPSAAQERPELHGLAPPAAAPARPMPAAAPAYVPAKWAGGGRRR